MTSKEKVNAAINHRPGPVPLDLGGGPTSGIHCSIVEGLREHYGLERGPVKVHEPFQMLGYIDDDLKDAMGIDVQPLWNPHTMFGFYIENWKPFRTPWGQDVLVPGKFEHDTLPNGDVVLYPNGNRSVPPSGRMPPSSFFFDAIIRQDEIDEDNLNPEDNLQEFGPISDEDLKRFGSMVEQHRENPRFLFGLFGGTALGDIALVPGLNLEHPRGIRDVTEWYISTAARQDYLHAVFEKQIDIALENLVRIHAVVGDAVGLVYICGTDFGTQSSTFCSPETFESLYKPYYRKVCDWIHGHTSWKVYKHTDGAITSLIPHFIEAGIDILNPIQWNAGGMDPVSLKREFGRDMVFWGAAVDTQKTLPFGTPAEVRAEVLKHLKIFSPGGGFVASSIHNIQARTPIENVVAMVEAIREFNA
ncbi:MAG: methyltransferase [Spirochaetaceae bacterium]|nr:MAG: methyltransferase [Spirochaetaceae bacterium]